MSLLGFGGHPMLHRYNLEMFRRQREELFRQAEYDRLICAAKGEKRRSWQPYHNSAIWLGTHLILLGRRLEHFGEVRENCPSPSASPHH
jgi:hypothetical protein